MGPERNRRCLSTAVSVALCLSVANRSCEPVEAAAGEPAGETLFLELVINELPTGRIVKVNRLNGHYYVASEDLEHTALRVGRAAGETVALDQLPGVRLDYEVERQRLVLSIPPDWLPHQTIGRTPRVADAATISSLGLLFNYDIHVLSSGRNHRRLSTLTELRAFDRWGAVTTTGVYHGPLAREPQPPSRFIRHDSTWRYTSDRRLIVATAGDVITGSLPWTQAARIGGVTFQRNFRIRPDLITHPIPQFAGQASVPSAVDLMINGRPTTQAVVAPGPFTVNEVPYVDGAGDAAITVTDALGRQTTTKTSFYVASSLLRRGLTDYSISAGWLRRGFGLRSFGYGTPIASGVGRYGVTDFLTLEGRADAASALLVAGAGAGLRVWHLGVVNLALSESRRHHRSGRSYVASYSYRRPLFTLSLQHQQSGSEFADLRVYDAVDEIVAARSIRRSDQATGALALGRAGTLSGGIFVVTRPDERARIAMLSYGRSFRHGVSIYATADRDLKERRPSVRLQVVVPVGARSSASIGVSRRDDGSYASRSVYRRSVAPDGGVGWSLGYASGDPSSRQAEVTWRTATFEAETGALMQNAGQTQWVNLAGSAVVMGGSVFPANRVRDAFALVDTNGQADVPVLFENQVVGRTNRRGRLLVPDVTAYYPAKYAIDPLDLPAGMRVPAVEQRFAVRQGGGAIVRFPIERLVAATVTLVDRDGAPLPLGTRVSHRESGMVAFVGWGGVVYIEGLASENHLTVTVPDGARCAVNFAADVDDLDIARIGPLVCGGP